MANDNSFGQAVNETVALSGTYDTSSGALSLSGIDAQSETWAVSATTSGEYLTGTFTTSNALVQEGSASGLLVPNGGSAAAYCLAFSNAILSPVISSDGSVGGTCVASNNESVGDASGLASDAGTVDVGCAGQMVDLTLSPDDGGFTLEGTNYRQRSGPNNGC